MAANLQWCFLLHAAMLSWLLQWQNTTMFPSCSKSGLGSYGSKYIMFPPWRSYAVLVAIVVSIYIYKIMFFLHPAKLLWWLWWQVYKFSSFKQQRCLGCYSGKYKRFFLCSVPLSCQAPNSQESNKTTSSCYEIFIKKPTSVTRNNTLWIV